MKRKLIALLMGLTLALSPTAASYGAMDASIAKSVVITSIAKDAATVNATDLKGALGSGSLDTMLSASAPRIGHFDNVRGTISGDTVYLYGAIPYAYTVADKCNGITEGHFIYLNTTSVGTYDWILLRPIAATKPTKAADYGRWTWTGADMSATGLDSVGLCLDLGYQNKRTFYVAENMDTEETNTGSNANGTTRAKGTPDHTNVSTFDPKTASEDMRKATDTVRRFTVDYSGATLLSKTETTSLEDWIKAVTAASDTPSYLTVEKMEKAYADLGAKLQTLIADVPDFKNTVAGSGLSADTAPEDYPANLNFKNVYADMQGAIAYVNYGGKALEASKKINELADTISRANDTHDALLTSVAQYETLKSWMDENGLGEATLGTLAFKDLSESFAGIKTQLNSKIIGNQKKLFESINSTKFDVTNLTDSDVKEITSLVSYVDADIIKPEDIGVKAKNYKAMVDALDTLNDKQNDLANATITIADSNSTTYTGKDLTPSVTAAINGTTIDAADLDITYMNNINAGKALVLIRGTEKSGLTGFKSAEFEIKPATIDPALVKLSASSAVLGGNYPAVTVPEGTTYTVSYTGTVGKATATVTVKGNYAGTVQKSFILKPAALKGLKVTAGKKKATVSYTAQKGASYQIVCKPTSGKSNTVTTSAAKKTVTGLKAGTYKVSVRAYAKVGGTTYYGSYATKSVRVK